MPIFETIEEFSDPYLKIVFQATPPKPTTYYGTTDFGKVC